ncbi:CD82 antigen [Lamellibrachia satsuma]|nr:CD82 antigen [Lamellibrachia satsuma]
MCTAGIAKKLLILFNVVFWLGGVALLGIGIWMRVDPTIVHYLNVVNIPQASPLLNYAGTIFIIVGAATFIIALIGLFGAIREHQGLLFIYAALVLVIMLTEVIAAVIALIYRVQMANVMMRSMKGQVMYKYRTNTTTMAAWDYLQNSMHCCGAINYTDYFNSVWYNGTSRKTTNGTEQQVPSSCCVKTDETHYLSWTGCQNDAKNQVQGSKLVKGRGCFPYLMMWFHHHSVIIVGLGFGVALIQLLGFVAACCLRSALKRTVKM